MTPCKVNSVLELVGNTPLVRINRMNPVPGVELLAKLELMNPGGSVKDRIGLRMIEQAEAAGELTPGKIVLEASSGNTAIGLAMVCAVKGYQLLVTMSESASEERKRILRAYGAQILLTPGYQGTDGAIEEAYRLAREEPDKYVLVDQFNNEANWQAHYDGTGKEIWEATGGKVDVVVLTMGTTGTLMGITRALRELNPAVRVVGVEPFKGHKIQGLKNMKESYAAGDLQAGGAAGDRQRGRRFGLRDGPAAGPGRGDLRGHERRGGHEGGPGRGPGLGPRHGRRPAARRRRAVSFHLAVRLRDGPRAAAFLQHPARQDGAARARLARQGDDLFLRAEPGRAARPGALPPGGLRRRAAALSRMPRLSGQARHEPRRHRRPHGQGVPQGGEKLRPFTARWEKVFFESLDTLRVKRAHHYPKASEHVADMVEQTRSLLEKGLAYEKLRSVYFRISSFPGYGKLSGIEPEQMRSEASTTYDYYEKDHPGDFALFKRPTLAELKAGIFWPTPWGNARPGWHVECACMAVRYLGQPIDIHTASTDLTFPHGDNEIAIACGLQDKPLAKLWMHSRSGHGRRQEGEPRGRQRPHLAGPAGAGLRRADRPLLAAGHALSHGAALLGAGASAGGRLRRAAQRVRRPARAFHPRPAQPRPGSGPLRDPRRLAGGDGQRPEPAQGPGEALCVGAPRQPAAERRGAGRRPGPPGPRLHAAGERRPGRDRLPARASPMPRWPGWSRPATRPAGRRISAGPTPSATSFSRWASI